MRSLKWKKCPSPLTSYQNFHITCPFQVAPLDSEFVTVIGLIHDAPCHGGNGADALFPGNDRARNFAVNDTVVE